MKKPQLVIVGGANGTGKSTFAYQYRDEYKLEYLGADDIANELKSSELRAGKVFFNRLEEYIEKKKSVIIESTLSGTGLIKRIKKFKEAGFFVTIVYVFLESAVLCKKRIKIRVKKGGHDVPPLDVERRFNRSINNFWNYYRYEADSWQILYNGNERPLEVAFDEKENIVICDEEYFSKFRGLLK